MKKLNFLPGLPAVALAKAGALTLFAFLLFTSCNNDKKQIETLTKETETIHDEAMKDLADMNRVARELKETIMVATMTAEQSAVYTDALTAMGNAENAMMDWMKNYKSPEEMAPPEAMKYLQEQKALIEKNRADIKAALEAGKKLQGK
ncbi:MAG: hypothetical protein H7246_19405 [Phycisphaerae bacterium]|nr:hypothetical protein [Saprospiraceae bacterium]